MTFSEVLPVHRYEEGRMWRIHDFNLWLRKWCHEEGFGLIEHSHSTWQNRNLYKKDGLHPSSVGTDILSEQFECFIRNHLN